MTERERVNWAGRTLRVRVDGPAHGGEFVARHEGRVVFCRGAITGELVDVVVDDDPGRAFCRGSVREVLEASPHRVAPRCPAAAAGAGCCDWSHIAPEAARRFSGTVLAEQAQRIGKIDTADTPVPVVAPAGDTSSTGWRTVARWVTGPDAIPGVRRAHSRQIITEPCVQVEPRLREAVEASGVAPGREVLGVLGDDQTIHVAHRPLDEPPARGGGSRRSATRTRARHARAGAWEPVAGPTSVLRRVGQRSWSLPLEAFWQAHRSAPRHYSDVVRDAIASTPGLSRGPEVWDLYGGAGVFAAAALDVAPGARVTLVESATASLGAADTGGQDVDGVRRVGSRVETFLEGVRPGGADTGPDVVVLDPPRGGAGIDVMVRLSELTRARIVHVGCDPASLARDVGVLVAAGWTLVDLSGVAAFPGTHHVEGLAILDAPATAGRHAAHR